MEGKVAALSHGNSKVIDFNSKLGRVPVNTITNKSVIQAITPSDRIVPIGSSTKINTNLERGSINSNSSINQGNKVVNFPNPKTNKTNTKTSTANTKINNIVSIVNSRRKSETSS